MNKKEFFMIALAVIVGIMVHNLVAPTLSSVTKLSL